MKDELEGCVIKEAYFLGIKQYGYICKDFITLDSNINFPDDWYPTYQII
jgi:hypothetical protein